VWPHEAKAAGRSPEYPSHRPVGLGRPDGLLLADLDPPLSDQVTKHLPELLIFRGWNFEFPGKSPWLERLVISIGNRCQDFLFEIGHRTNRSQNDKCRMTNVERMSKEFPTTNKRHNGFVGAWLLRFLAFRAS
jgi:hypothetical protein